MFISTRDKLLRMTSDRYDCLITLRCSPGSFVSFYFDDRIIEGDPASTRDTIVEIAKEDGDALVAVFVWFDLEIARLPVARL